jgi:site-specific DNA-adenine methylase
MPKLRAYVAMKKFGISYMGSKSGIARVICRSLPGAENFYDLFGGGFAITHCMLALHRTKYRRFFFNEIDAGTTELIRRAIRGEFNYDRFKPPFVSREEFHRKKATCAYTRILWSFGNHQRGYLFGDDIEDYKRSLHNAVVFNDFDATARRVIGKDRFDERSTIPQRRFCVRRIVKARNPTKRASELEQLERLERLQQLERLQRLEGLSDSMLEMTSLDYREVPIRPNSVVYCDPPYANTRAECVRGFDSAAFWSWAERLEHPAFISEYEAPETFRVVLSIEKKTKVSGGTIPTKNEILFANPAAAKLLESIGAKTFPNTGARRAHR